LKNLVV